MTPDERFPDDAVLRRVAAARPAICEDDLSPTGARAAVIAERVTGRRRARAPRPRPRAPQPPPQPKPHPQPAVDHLPVVLGGLGAMVAAACAAVAIATVRPGGLPSSGRPAADVITVDVATATVPRSVQRAMARTPLGAEIERRRHAIEQSVRTGDAAQNRTAIAQLTGNRTACELAATAVLRVDAQRSQRAAQRHWALGVRLQATGDRQLASALRARDEGRTAAGWRELAVALDTLNRSAGLTGRAEDALGGDPGPPPHDP